MCKKVKLTGLLLLMAAFVLPVKAQAADDALRDLLRKKEVITHQEAEKIRIETAEKKADYLISTEGMNLQIGGELELEYVDTEKDANIENPDGRFQLDKFVLEPVVTFDDHDVSLEAKLEFDDSEAFFDEGVVCFAGLPLESKLSIGLDQRFIGAKRKTEVYPLLGTAMWRYEAFQLMWEGEAEPFYWGVSFGEGLRLGTKQVAEDSSYEMLRDNRNAGEKTGHPEWGVKLGVKPEIGVGGKLDILGFGFWGELSEDDKDTLNSELPNYASTSDEQSRYGGRLTYKYKFDKLRELTLVGEIARLEDGALDRNGWYVQASHKWKFKRPYFRSFEPLIRYEQLDTDWEKSFNKPVSWDREMTTIALITELAKNVKLKTEYYINDEKTGRREVDNDEFLMQLEFKF